MDRRTQESWKPRTATLAVPQNSLWSSLMNVSTSDEELLSATVPVAYSLAAIALDTSASSIRSLASWLDSWAATPHLGYRFRRPEFNLRLALCRTFLCACTRCNRCGVGLKWSAFPRHIHQVAAGQRIHFRVCTSWVKCADSTTEKLLEPRNLAECSAIRTASRTTARAVVASHLLLFDDEDRLVCAMVRRPVNKVRLGREKRP